MKIIHIFILSAILAISSCNRVTELPSYDVTSFGAVGDTLTDCTEAFNKAIDECNVTGGRVVVPPGAYLCRTIHLKSNVELFLEDGSVILGDTDAEHYESFIPHHDLSRFDSGDGTVNQNNSRDARWNKALFIADGLENVRIHGNGTIDGRHVFDPLGEENMRGPHCIIAAECSNLSIEGITITRASNYAVMCYAVSNSEFRNLNITEGWDGIHIRGGDNILIDGCNFETGDDSIAGGYWNGFEIRDCSINSSCNGIRMIMPCNTLEIHDCSFFGPGRYPHRTSGELRRTNMLFGICLEPGGWGRAPGDIKNVSIHDCTMSNVSSPVATSISKDNTAYDLDIRNIVATGVYGTMSPVVCYNDKGFESISIENYIIER